MEPYSTLFKGDPIMEPDYSHKRGPRSGVQDEDSNQLLHPTQTFLTQRVLDTVMGDTSPNNNRNS